MPDLIQRLQEKVQAAVLEISSTRKDRDRLAAELELIRAENRRARRVLREHAELVDERHKIKEKLEGLNEKLSQLGV